MKSSELPSASGFWILAEDYRVAAVALREGVKARRIMQRTEAPRLHCLSHAAELFMKACLLRSDPTFDLKRIGHDLSETYAALAEDPVNADVRDAAEEEALVRIATVPRDAVGSEQEAVVDAYVSNAPLPTFEMGSDHGLAVQQIIEFLGFEHRTAGGLNRYPVNRISEVLTVSQDRQPVRIDLHLAECWLEAFRNASRDSIFGAVAEM